MLQSCIRCKTLATHSRAALIENLQHAEWATCDSRWPTQKTGVSKHLERRPFLLLEFFESWWWTCFQLLEIWFNSFDLYFSGDSTRISNLLDWRCQLIFTWRNPYWLGIDGIDECNSATWENHHPNETLWPSCCRRHLSINCVFTATKNGNLTSALLLPFLVASMGSVTCIPNSFHIFYDSLRKKNHLLTYQMLVLPCLLGSKNTY